MVPLADESEFLGVLRQARALVADQERWLPAGFAANANGRWVPVGSKDAVRFSLLGAVIRAGGKAVWLASAADRYLAGSLREKLTTGSSVLSHAETLTALDALIAAYEVNEPFAPPVSSEPPALQIDGMPPVSLATMRRYLQMRDDEEK